MAASHVCEVPEPLHNELRPVARAERWSLCAEVVPLLDGALMRKRSRARESNTLADLDRLRFKLPPGRAPWGGMAANSLPIQHRLEPRIADRGPQT